MYKIKTCGIYLITNTINDKVYVGQSIDIERRIREYKNRYGKKEGEKQLIIRAMLKYGFEKFDHKILEECSREELNDKEIFWIDKYDCISPKGYNLKSGGTQNCYYSEDTKKKMSDGRKGDKHWNYGKHHSEETRVKIAYTNGGENSYWFGREITDEHRESLSRSKSGENHPMFGKHHTEESKKLISEKQKGREFSEETRNKISKSKIGRPLAESTKTNLAISRMNGKKIGCSNGKIYLSRKEASEDTLVKGNSIKDVCTGKCKATTKEKMVFWYIHPE